MRYLILIICHLEFIIYHLQTPTFRYSILMFNRVEPSLTVGLLHCFVHSCARTLIFYYSNILILRSRALFSYPFGSRKSGLITRHSAGMRIMAPSRHAEMDTTTRNPKNLIGVKLEKSITVKPTITESALKMIPRPVVVRVI